MRDDVTFTSGGERCAAWWYRPDGERGEDATCVVMGHGFSLTREDGLPAYAEAFAAAGLHVLAFDYRFLGDSGGRPRQRVRIADQLQDWENAIAHAQGLPGVGRIVLWGFSLGGGHVTTLALRRRDLAGVLALCPFVDGLARVRASDPKTVAWILPRALLDVAGRPQLIPVTGPPGANAAMTLPGEAEGFARAVPAGSRWRNVVGPGLFVTVAAHRPVARARRIACPLWVGVGERDVSTSKASVERLAGTAPHAHLDRYDFDHFEPFEQDAPTRIAGDQVAFLRRHGLA